MQNTTFLESYSIYLTFIYSIKSFSYNEAEEEPFFPCAFPGKMCVKSGQCVSVGSTSYPHGHALVRSMILAG